MHLSRYLKIYPCTDEPGRLLLYSTKRGASILVPASLLVALGNGAIAPADRDCLARLGFLVPDTDAERLEMAATFVEANRQRRSFSAIVVLNLDCNLACTYCFEGGMKGKTYMSRDTADLLADYVEREQIGRGK